MSLIEHLKHVRDYRTQPRYPLWAVLVLVIMGTMSGAVGRAVSLSLGDI
jgi:hypothetical protein